MLKRSRIPEWGLLGGAWVVIACMVATQTHFYRSAVQSHFSWQESIRYPLVECTFWAVLTPLIFWLARRLPLHVRDWPRNVAALLAINIAIELLHAAYRVPLHSFVYNDQFPLRVLFRYYLLGNSLNDFWVYWTILGIAYLLAYERRVRERDAQLANAQLQVLKAQLQPHFLFNTLNSISYLMREDVEAADDMITHLADMLRLTLRDDGRYLVPLREELTIVDKYCAIQRLRFPDTLRIDIAVPPDALHVSVPSLVLLPLVENSVRHGLSKRAGKGTIRVTAAVKLQTLMLQVLDDGIGARNPIVEGIGLSNVRKRLAMHYGSVHSFTYGNRPEGGFLVEFTVPIAHDAALSTAAPVEQHASTYC